MMDLICCSKLLNLAGLKSSSSSAIRASSDSILNAWECMFGVCVMISS